MGAVLTSSLIQACPYAFAVDPQGFIQDVGAYLGGRVAGLIGQHFDAAFAVGGPKAKEGRASHDVAVAKSLSGERIELEVLGAPNLVIVGTFFATNEGRHVFIGTLSPSLATEVDKLNLTVSDFAPFDVLPDFAMMAQINHSVLVDTRLLNHKLTKARDDAIAAQQAIEAVAMRDSLTGLGSRAAFRQFVGATDSDGCNVVHLLLFDLNRFKPINDQFGHQVGDQLLEVVGQRIKESVGDLGKPYRLGGDEFSVVYVDVDRDTVARNASAIIRAVSQECIIENKSIRVGASGGLATCPDDVSDCQSLYKAADIALYDAKTDKDRDLVCFNSDLANRALEMTVLQAELVHAVHDRQFTNVYQPKFDLDSGELVGVEALVRWHNERRNGFVSPMEFIPLAEQTGLVPHIDLQVCDRAFRQLRIWADRGIMVPVSVNLSPITLEQSDLMGQFDKLLRRHGVAESDVEVEITEQAIIRNSEAVERNLKGFRERRISIAIDDFGAGQTSLSYLKRLPVSHLKLDRSLIQDIDTSRPGFVIVATLIKLAKSLGLKLTAEGIENEFQADLLREPGGVTGQGFFLARPLAADALDPILGPSGARVRQAV